MIGLDLLGASGGSVYYRSRGCTLCGIDFPDWAKHTFGGVHTGGKIVLSAFGLSEVAKQLEQAEADAGLLPEWAGGKREGGDAAPAGGPQGPPGNYFIVPTPAPKAPPPIAAPEDPLDYLKSPEYRKRLAEVAAMRRRAGTGAASRARDLARE